MDFQSLSRRELQALCKINKIPANMTNLAMADALHSLQHVEGMDDFMRVTESEPQSPMIAASGLQEAPRSVCRTATRTKLAKEPESAVSKTRGRPRTKIDEDLPPYTPAVASRSRRAPVAAFAAKNPESVACSTRRSVRLAALSLNQKERTQPIKIDDMSNVQEEQEDDVLSDVDVKVVMEKGSESTIVSSIVSDQDSSEAVQTTLDSKVDVQEDKVVELYDADVKCDTDSAMCDVKEIVVEQHVVSEEILAGDVIVSCEATEESDESTVEKLECTLEQNLDDEKALLEKNDCDDLPVVNGKADVEMSSDDVNVDIEEDLVVEQPTVVVESVELPGECMGTVALPEENETKSDCLEDYDEPKLSIMNPSAAVVSTTETATKSVEEELVMTESATVSVEEEFVTATSEQSSTMDTSSTPVMKISPLPVISNLESKGKIPYSDWVVDPVMGQIPRPTHLIPRKSSRMEEELMDINKENVDRSGGLVHRIEISDEKKASTPLDKKSLRKLSKMVREKLQIQTNSKINDCQSAVQEKQLGKSRLALQALPENNQE